MTTAKAARKPHAAGLCALFSGVKTAFFSRADNSRRGVAQHFDIPRVNLLRQGFLCYILAGFGMDSSFLSPTLLCS